MTTTEQPSAADSVQHTLPKWSIGDVTGTLFRDGDPTGTEIRQYNTGGGTAHDLVAQANAAPDLLAACKAMIADLNAGRDPASGQSFRDACAAIARAEGRP